MSSVVSARHFLHDIGRDVLELFREARAAQMPLAEISLQFGSLHITARELRGGAIIFLFPQTALLADANPLTPMTSKEINQLVTQIETHIECWKQFNHFISLARAKKFGPADDNHFLEIKSIIVQELELIFAAIEVQSPTREEIHGLITNAPSLRYLERDERRRPARPRNPVAQDLHRLARHPRPAQGQAARGGKQILLGREKIILPRHPALRPGKSFRQTAIMLSYFQILILALIQGACELLPVSSSAHVIAAEKLMG